MASFAVIIYYYDISYGSRIFVDDFDNQNVTCAKRFHRSKNSDVLMGYLSFILILLSHIKPEAEMLYTLYKVLKRNALFHEKNTKEEMDIGHSVPL